MENWPILSLIVFLPLVGAALVLMIRGDADDVARRARAVALWTSMMTFVLALALWSFFDSASADYQFVESKPWIPGLNVN
ncbi:MAG: NADH-quinone oxidoreductase subunit M, partial [Alphaproteobacteria bacterium]